MLRTAVHQDFDRGASMIGRSVLLPLSYIALGLLTGCVTTKPSPAEYGSPPTDYERKAKDALWERLGSLAERSTYVSCEEPRRAYQTGTAYQGYKIIWVGYDVVVHYRVKNFVGYTNTDVSHVLFTGEKAVEVWDPRYPNLHWADEPKN